MHKKIIALCLICSVLGSSTAAFATTNTDSTLNNNTSIQATTNAGNVTTSKDVTAVSTENVPSEVIGLNKYITRNSNGTLTLDVKTAIKSGYQSKTVKGLSKYLDSLNTPIKAGELVTDNNLNIKDKTTTTNSNIVTAAVADRGVTVTHVFWWGFNRYISNLTVHKVVGNLNAIAIGGTTAGGVCTALGAGVPGVIADVVTVGYISLLANRIDTNNIGRGVCVHMTYAMVYTVVSQ
jgi:hypothetical protein